MQPLEVSGAVRSLYVSLGFKGLNIFLDVVVLLTDTYTYCCTDLTENTTFPLQKPAC